MIIISTILIVSILTYVIRDMTLRESYLNSSIPIFIVSIPSRKHSRLLPLLTNIKSDPRYHVSEVYGVVGKEVVEDFLNKGQIGCFMSHYGIWKKMLTLNQNYVLILEDDAIISLPEDFQSIQTTIDNLPSNWDVCYLGGEYQDSKSVYIVNKNIVRSDTSVMWRSHAYLITKSAALSLVKQSKEVLEKNRISDFDIILPVDDWMTHPHRRLNVYNTDPRIVDFIHDGISDTSTMY